MQTTIKSYPLPLQDLPDFFIEHFITIHGLELKQSQTIVDNHLRPELDKMLDDVHALVEYPYVDKMYRNTFYHYYSSKLKLFSRDSTRISFFKNKVDPELLKNEEYVEGIKNDYLGFIIVRPTFPKIIGRSSISPEILKNKNFICCKCRIQATSNHVKFEVNAFPHASQDGQFITCAETTIWSILEYFSNRYSDYQPILPSTIHELFKKFSYKRQLPSEGMTAEQIAFVVREVGFGTMFYSSITHTTDFLPIVSIFIESGIPVIGVITYSVNKGHALNIIGREKEDPRLLAESTTFIPSTDDFQLIDFHHQTRNFVFIDDNHPPYQIATLQEPGKHYNQQEWHNARLTNIIVPLYHRIYLDAIRARSNFINAIKKIKRLNIPKTPLIIRIFLASSRSYKEYIMLNKELHSETKQAVSQLVMPKFIWVAELSTPDTYIKECADGVLLQDATEPSETTDQSELSDMPVFCGWFDNKFFSNYSHTQEIVDIFAARFTTYHGNLQ